MIHSSTLLLFFLVLNSWKIGVNGDHKPEDFGFVSSPSGYKMIYMKPNGNMQIIWLSVTPEKTATFQFFPRDKSLEVKDGVLEIVDHDGKKTSVPETGWELPPEPKEEPQPRSIDSEEFAPKKKALARVWKSATNKVKNIFNFKRISFKQLSGKKINFRSISSGFGKSFRRSKKEGGEQREGGPKKPSFMPKKISSGLKKVKSFLNFKQLFGKKMSLPSGKGFAKLFRKSKKEGGEQVEGGSKKSSFVPKNISSGLKKVKSWFNFKKLFGEKMSLPSGKGFGKLFRKSKKGGGEQVEGGSKKSSFMPKNISSGLKKVKSWFNFKKLFGKKISLPKNKKISSSFKGWFKRGNKAEKQKQEVDHTNPDVA